MSREVVCADAVGWLNSHPRSGTVITSPPDAGELGMTIGEWEGWFWSAARACFRAAGARPTVFYLSDRKSEGRVVSKAHIVMTAANQQGLGMLWHKIVLRRPVGSVNLHRPGFDHLIAFGGPACRPGKATPDVIERGRALWLHGMGERPTAVAVELARQHGGPVVAPFCGKGSVLASAEAGGLDVVGIDRDPEMCALAERAVWV